MSNVNSVKKKSSDAKYSIIKRDNLFVIFIPAAFYHTVNDLLVICQFMEDYYMALL